MNRRLNTKGTVSKIIYTYTRALYTSLLSTAHFELAGAMETASKLGGRVVGTMYQANILS